MARSSKVINYIKLHNIINVFILGILCETSLITKEIFNVIYFIVIIIVIIILLLLCTLMHLITKYL